MGFLTLRRFAPACGCPSVSRPSIARAHDPFESRWRRCGDVGFRPSGPTVVGRSSTPDGIGRGIDRPDREIRCKGQSIEDLRLGFWASLPSAVRTRHRSSFAAGRSCLGFRRGPSQGVARRCASSRASWSSALATRTLSQSVACRAASSRRARTSAPRASPSFFGRTRHSPGTSAVQLVARGASSVCEGMSGPAASNTDDLLPVTDCPWNVLNGRREPLRDAACQTSFSNRPLSEAFAPSVWK